MLISIRRPLSDYI